MALFKITKSIFTKKKFEVFNLGNMKGILLTLMTVLSISKIFIVNHLKTKNTLSIFNIASSSPKKLKYFINLIEKETKLNLKSKFIPKQKGDVEKTYASTQAIKKVIGKNQNNRYSKGTKSFVEWYKSYYKI